MSERKLNASQEAFLERLVQASVAAKAKFATRNVACLNCEQAIAYSKRRNKYCNHSCRQTHLNSLRDYKNKCKRCSIAIKYDKRYCAPCKEILTDFDSLKTDGARKKVLIAERGYKCEICSLSEWCGKTLPLELDHSDGNSDNNVRANLRLLCGNCHSQTPTYRNKNRGKAGLRAQKRRTKLATMKEISP